MGGWRHGTSAAEASATADDVDGDNRRTRPRGDNGAEKTNKNGFKTMQNGQKTIQNGSKTSEKRLKTAEKEIYIIGYMYSLTE